MTQDRVALEARRADALIREWASEPARGARRPELLAELAVALGLYRLRGGPPCADRRLTADQALAALFVLSDWLTQASASARELPTVWDQCDEIDEALSASHALLSDRFHFHAAEFALEEALRHATERTDELGESLARFRADLNDLSDQMQESRELFYEEARVGTMAEWREQLAPAYRSALPWWLSPDLEEEARQVREWAEQTVARRLRPALTWQSPDGSCQALLHIESEGLRLTFDPAEGLQGRAIWLGGHMAAIEEGIALVRASERIVGPGLKLAVGQPGRIWSRLD